MDPPNAEFMFAMIADYLLKREAEALKSATGKVEVRRTDKNGCKSYTGKWSLILQI